MIEFKIIGNLGDDAVMNEHDGKKIINFAVCHSEAYNKRNSVGKEIQQFWADCSYNSDSIELLGMLKKGTLVYATGRPDVKVHIKKDGTPNASQYLRVSKIEILSKKKKES
jgi:single-strand DNA-binding protein